MHTFNFCLYTYLLERHKCILLHELNTITLNHDYFFYDTIQLLTLHVWNIFSYWICCIINSYAKTFIVICVCIIDLFLILQNVFYLNYYIKSNRAVIQSNKLFKLIDSTYKKREVTLMFFNSTFCSRPCSHVKDVG